MSAVDLLRVTPGQLVEIQKMFGKTQEEIDDYKRILKQWLKQQNHIPQDMDDRVLEIFLQFSKFSLEKAKKKIDMYYTVRTLVPEIYMDREPMNSRLQQTMSVGAYFPLPKLTDDLCRVHLSRLMVDDADALDAWDYFKLVFVVADMRLKYENCLWDHFIFDLSNIRMSHVTKVTPTIIKKVVTIAQKAYVDKIRGIHFVNAPHYTHAVINVLKSIMNEKIGNRIFLHKDVESLHQAIPKEILPSDYEGLERSVSELQDEWKKFLISHNDWYIEQRDKKSNEKLRPGIPMDSSIFGIEGSFRKLSVD